MPSRPLSLRDQCDKCRHFTGLGSNADGSRVPITSKSRGTCKANVNYDDVCKQGSRMIAMPCFHEEPDNMPSDGVWPTCPSQSFKSAEELDAEVLSIECGVKEFFDRARIVRPAILKHAGWEEDAVATESINRQRQGASGEMACPICKTGTLRYSVAGCNGHVHAMCSTDKCVQWME